MSTVGGITSSDLTTLGVALDQLIDVLVTRRTGGGASSAQALRARTTVLRSQLNALPEAMLQSVDATLIRMVTSDAEQYCSAHTADSEPGDVAEVVLRRLGNSTALLATVLSELAASPTVPSAEESAALAGASERTSAAGVSQLKSQQQLSKVVADYERDAQREQRRSWLHRALAIMLASAALGTTLWCVHLATSSPSRLTTGGAGRPSLGARDVTVWPSVLGPLIVTLVLGLLALFEVRAAASARRSAREFVRLQRGLASLDAYLAPLPLPAQYLLRASMTQSFFQPLLEDKDPLRYPQWPDTDALAQSVMDVVEETNENADRVEDTPSGVDDGPPSSAPPTGASVPVGG